MIKINLAKANSAVEASSAPAGMSLEGGPGLVVAKVLAMLVFVFGLYIYEGNVVDGKKKKLNNLNQQLQGIQSQIGQYGGVRTVVEDLAKEREKLKSQMVVIQKISQKRAFKMQTIETLQSAMTDDCWLEALNIKKGAIDLKGYARVPSSVQAIVSQLDGLGFLSAYNKELTRKKLGITNVHQFNILAEVKE